MLILLLLMMIRVFDVDGCWMDGWRRRRERKECREDEVEEEEGC